MTLPQLLSGLVLVGIRIAGLFVFMPFFSSASIPVRIKTAMAVSFTLAAGPMLLSLPGAHVELGVASVLGECAVSLVFGLTVSLLMELANMTGQLVGLQTSFTLVNLIDPNSQVEITLFSQMFQLLVVTLMVTAGLDRILLLGLLRTFVVLPPGAALTQAGGLRDILPLVSGVFLAAFQLAAPLLAATTLIEVAIALMSKLSPQLPVMALTIPAKTMISLLVLISSLSFWNSFLEHRFAQLLDAAQSAVVHSFRPGA